MLRIFLPDFLRINPQTPNSGLINPAFWLEFCSNAMGKNLRVKTLIYAKLHYRILKLPGRLAIF